MPRRIVTGQRDDGQSCVLHNEELEQDFRGVGSYRLWAADDLSSLRLPCTEGAATLETALSSAENSEALRTATPQPQHSGQWRVSLHEMAPGREGGEDVRPFLHWHDTLDLQWLISGALTISLDGGEQVEMAPGDVVVQHGTNHAWQAGPEGALLAIFMYGAERVGLEPPSEDKLDPSRWAQQGERARAAGTPPGGPEVRTAIADFLDRDPRRLVTGQTGNGTSVFARVEDAVADSRDHRNGVRVHRIWADDQLVPIELPYLGAAAPLACAPSAEETAEALRTSSPHAGPGGLRVSLVKFEPTAGGLQFPLHWHDTIDVQWLFAGELTIGFDDGSEVTMRPGDAVIQHGTNHSWRVGPEGAIVGLVMLGVERDGLVPPEDMRVDNTPAATG